LGNLHKGQFLENSGAYTSVMRKYLSIMCKAYFAKSLNIMLEWIAENHGGSDPDAVVDGALDIERTKVLLAVQVDFLAALNTRLGQVRA